MVPLLLTAGTVVVVSAFCSLCEAVLYALFGAMIISGLLVAAGRLYRPGGRG